MGGQNCHIDIQFDDGQTWIARLRLEEPTVPPAQTRERILASEANTLRFLAQTNLHVPKVFYYSTTPNDIGPPFILMEKLPGKPLEWSECSAEQKSKIMLQLADIFLELEKFPLQATGSLCSEDGQVGAFTQGHMLSTPSLAIGPFDNLADSLTAVLRHELKMITSGELGTFPVDNYLTHFWRLEHVPALAAGTTAGSFYIKHFDDKGDHILVDEQYNITGIIDWESASAESKEIAFSSPCMMWPVENFYDGSNQLSDEEIEFADIFRRRSRKDLADIVLRGRKYQRFLFFLGAAVSVERSEFQSLFQGLREALEGKTIEPYSDWKSTTIARKFEDDMDLQRLMLLHP